MHIYSKSASLARNVYQNLLDNVLPNLHFPVLSEVIVSHRTGAFFHLPRFENFAPNIKRLDLYGLGNYHAFTGLLENLCNSRVALRSFQVHVDSLSPELLDQLALYLPSLESLIIIYKGFANEPDGLTHVVCNILALNPS
jgi:hypothetical protein